MYLLENYYLLFKNYYVFITESLSFIKEYLYYYFICTKLEYIISLL